MSDNIIIDFRLLRPQYTTKDQPAADLPIRLCAQLWPESDSPVLDCCYCDAIELNTPETILSMADLVYDDRNHDFSREQQTEAARIFAANLRTEFNDRKLICIIPDSTNDFELSTVRNQLNSHFTDVDFLPASIAAVFDWQQRSSAKLTDRQLIIVIDAMRSALQLTPIQTAEDTKNKRIVLERHPGTTIKAPDLLNQLATLTQACKLPEIMTDFPGWNGLASECGKLVILHRDNWHELMEKDADQFRQLEIDCQSLQQEISNLCAALNYKATPILLCASELVRHPDIPACTPCLGGMEWLRQQQQSPGLPLWYDYLPELSMEVMRNGKFEQFPLISRENRRIAPVRGKTVTLSLNTRFTLPGGLECCRFPLFRGKGGTALSFNAEIHSSAFPLKEPTDCELTLTYTYGAEEPFELTFKGSFGKARCHWVPMPRPNPAKVGIAPPVKDPLGIERLQSFRFKPELQPVNLLSSFIQLLTPRFKKVKQGFLKRILLNKNDELMCFVTVEQTDVLCHSRDFCERMPSFEPNRPVYISHIKREVANDGCTLYFGKGITFSEPLTPEKKLPGPSDIAPLVAEATFISYEYIVESVGKSGFITNASTDSNNFPYYDVQLSQEQYKVRCYHNDNTPSLCIGDHVYVSDIKSKLTNNGYTLYSGHISTQKKIRLSINSTEYLAPSLFLHKLETELSCGDTIYCLLDNNRDIQYLSTRKITTPVFEGALALDPTLIKYSKLIWKNRPDSEKLPEDFIKEYKKCIEQLLDLTHNLTLGSPKKLALLHKILSPSANKFVPSIRQHIFDQISSLEKEPENLIPENAAWVLANLQDLGQRQQFSAIRSLLSHQSAEVREKAFKTCSYMMEYNEVVATQFIEKDMECLYRCCVMRIKEHLYALQHLVANNTTPPNPIVDDIRRTCSTIWSMLKSRRSEDNKVKTFLCLHNDRCRELLALIKELHNLIVDAKEASSSTLFDKLFPCLYRLCNYLGDDNISNAITITDELENDDEDNDDY